MLNRNSVNFSSTVNKQIFLKNKIKKTDKCKLKTLNGKSMFSIIKKESIIHLKLIGQFDNKFLIFINIDNSIYIFDQHAVHERILYEYYSVLLINELTNDYKELPKESIVKNNRFNNIYSKLYLPQTIEIDEVVLHNIPKIYNTGELNSLFHFEFIKMNNKIHLVAIPIIFDRILDRNVYIELFSKITKNFDNIIDMSDRKLKTYFQNSIFEIYQEIVKSKACRDSVKFGENLDKIFIENLINELKQCSNPFLCAHGRHNFFIVNFKK